MQDILLPTLNEITAIVISVFLGTGAYLGFMIIKKHQKINIPTMVWILLINCFVTFICSEVLKLWNWGGYRTVFLPLIAYAGQYLMAWFDKRNVKIFDSAAGKIGLDTKDKEKDDYEQDFETEENKGNPTEDIDN